MLKSLYPHEYLESVFSIDYAKLVALGYRGVIFDIDNTLVHHGADSTAEIESLFRAIHGLGLRTLLLSNNEEARVRRFLGSNTETLAIAEALKPNPASYLEALRLLSLEAAEVIYVGDQIFTDILGANRAGIKSILVKFMQREHETKIGIRRRIERLVLWIYGLSRKYHHRLGDVTDSSNTLPPARKRRLFGELNPLFYAIATQKEILRRHWMDVWGRDKFASRGTKTRLGNLVSTQCVCMIKRGVGIQAEHQENKAANIRLACERIHGVILEPGQTFSFWRTIGKMSRRRGYRDGRVIINNRLTAGIGGGLCNLAHALHQVVLHSPLEITEFHKHSDALAPDQGERHPFSAGTSVSYNYVDFRFRNTTAQEVQLLAWCEGDDLRVELRSETEFPWVYELSEEDQHYKKVSTKFFRRSQIFRRTVLRSTGEVIRKERILDNLSEVMYDPQLIPLGQIRA